jgi:hypothetical protein
MKRQSPTVELILQLDAEYRKKAETGELKKIAPKRHNPNGEAWLPILTTELEGWRFTVLFSNTARAHELGKTQDWVVVYYDEGGGEDKCTVVTEYAGPMVGKRVIRGREKECAEYYNTEGWDQRVRDEQQAE